MARIDVLPSIEIIRGFKGILDFYVWRGLPCVRAWPKYRPARQTDASLAAALTFGAIVKAYSLMGEIALQAYRDDAKDQPRSARDIYVSSQYGNLHEANMSDFMDAIIIIRDAVVALTDLLHALDSIDTDEIVVNVDQSVLPPLAATTTNQTTQITALQKLDDLQDALESKALDRLLVRGMNQLFSIKGVLRIRVSAKISGNNGYIESTSPSAGEFWLITTMVASDSTTATTRIRFDHRRAAVNYRVDAQTRAFGIGEEKTWSGFHAMAEDDVIRAYFDGGLANDDCLLWLLGYTMTRET